MKDGTVPTFKDPEIPIDGVGLLNIDEHCDLDGRKNDSISIYILQILVDFATRVVRVYFLERFHATFVWG